MGHEPNYTTVPARGCIVDVKVLPEAPQLSETAVCFGCPRNADGRGEGLALPATPPPQPLSLSGSSILRLMAEVA